MSVINPKKHLGGFILLESLFAAALIALAVSLILNAYSIFLVPYERKNETEKINFTARVSAAFKALTPLMAANLNNTADPFPTIPKPGTVASYKFVSARGKAPDGTATDYNIYTVTFVLPDASSETALILYKPIP